MGAFIRWMAVSAIAHTIWLGLLAAVSTSAHGQNPFRRLQADDCGGGAWNGKTTIADDGSPYPTPGGIVRAVPVTLEHWSTVRAFQYWCAAGADQNLGQVTMTLYTAPPDGGASERVANASATGADAVCTAGWNSGPFESADALPAGDYWLTIWTERAWTTSFSPGTHMFGATDAVGETLDGLSTYSSHGDNSAVPIAVQVTLHALLTIVRAPPLVAHGGAQTVATPQFCDVSSYEACLVPCFEVLEPPEEQEDGSQDFDAMCFWLTRLMTRNADSGNVTFDPCFDVLGCSDEFLRAPADMLAQCQEGYHGFAADVALHGAVNVVDRASENILLGNFETNIDEGSTALFALGSGFDRTTGAPALALFFSIPSLSL